MKALKIMGCVLLLAPLWPIMAVRLVGWAITGVCDGLLARCTLFRGIGEILERNTQ